MVGIPFPFFSGDGRGGARGIGVVRVYGDRVPSGTPPDKADASPSPHPLGQADGRIATEGSLHRPHPVGVGGRGRHFAINHPRGNKGQRASQVGRKVRLAGSFVGWG